ncbi:amidohydrolase family protein [Pseudomonas sp. TCU-HL1]|uniref:amidohydrolase family protein n=1 Tax=Pseudomonas sp. TCU-HL1 TaxID=1856685 RepID=UPI00083E4FBE|nr:amidohydrolase family protein [Pseudomonas sp. TCU-HL1]AOE83439.1 amidohydrolase [Pseudomonas sp. TCU-HL1]
MKLRQNILVKNPVAVMTGRRGSLARAGQVDIRISDGLIHEMGSDLVAHPGERVIDASDCVVYPGWVNTHHHLVQNLLKAVPAGLNQGLEEWLASVPYPRLARFTPELVRIAARLGMAELLLSGVTTCADHHYLYHAGGSTESGDVLFDVAEEFGMRFVLCRGGALESAASHPGLSRTALKPESLDAMLGDVERLKARYHQSASDAMRRVVIAPTTPTFSLPPGLLGELAHAARSMDLRLHSHLSETQNYVRFCREKYNCLPVEFVAEHEWLGPDVWFAHMVHLQPSEIRLLAQTGTGVSHCPVSNSRLGSGVAPIPQMAAAGVPISLGVDGVASNESGSMTNEVNTAWLLHRATQGASATEAEDVIHWASAGGSQVLGLGAVGSLEVGQAADLVLYDINHPRFFGFHDVALAPVVAGEPIAVRYSIISGCVVVDRGVIPGLDLARLRSDARDGVQQLLIELDNAG